MPCIPPTPETSQDRRHWRPRRSLDDLYQLPANALLLKEEAATYLMICTSTLERIPVKELSFAKMGHQRRYRISDLTAYVESKMVKPKVRRGRKLKDYSHLKAL